MNLSCMQKLGRLLADFVQTFRPAAKMVSIAGFLQQFDLDIAYRLYTFVCLCIYKLSGGGKPGKTQYSYVF